MVKGLYLEVLDLLYLNWLDKWKLWTSIKDGVYLVVEESARVKGIELGNCRRDSIFHWSDIGGGRITLPEP